ncbi:MAG TPA: ABC transporter substrate-binding protein [Rhizobiaceae bacterium]|nr:ABC transporter substrate-binding protein [Rhizobiaceae bacterium]
MRSFTRYLALATATAVLLSTGTAPTLSAELKKVTYAIATADLNVGYPFATLAKALGYFEEEGLDVDIVPGQSSATTAQLLLTGRADVGVAQPDPVMIQRANQKIPLISFYAVSRRGTNVFVVAPDSPLQGVKDFKGKKVGVGDLGSGSVTYLRARLIDEGMSMSDVQLVATGYGTPGFEALKNGVVDVAVSFTGGVARMSVAGYKIRSLPQSADEENQYSYNLYATSDYIEANPDVIKGIGRATAKATIFLKNNPEAAVRAFWAYAPDRAPKDPNDAAAMERDLSILKAQLRDMGADSNPDDFPWGSQDVAVFDKIQKYLIAAEQIKTPADPSSFFTNEFAAAYVDFDTAPIATAAKNAK